MFPFPLGGSIKRTTWGSPTELWLVTEKKTIFLLPTGVQLCQGSLAGSHLTKALVSPYVNGASPPAHTRVAAESWRPCEEGARCSLYIPSTSSTLITPSTGQSLKKTKKTLCSESKAEKKRQDNLTRSCEDRPGIPRPAVVPIMKASTQTLQELILHGVPTGGRSHGETAKGEIVPNYLEHRKTNLINTVISS